MTQNMQQTGGPFSEKETHRLPVTGRSSHLVRLVHHNSGVHIFDFEKNPLLQLVVDKLSHVLFHYCADDLHVPVVVYCNAFARGESWW